ncbi:MAG: phosphoenolpyruvate--protein phosphotransferase [Candidatus Omnitrophica bacterium 4484_70.1]|nr:MAG: phosphoenolpyruvate--protein phosphotransferase [Candidatus Omnitrophica bacterium 4484_70.1]
MIRIKGIGASPGVVKGKAFYFSKEEFFIPRRKIDYADISREIYHLEEALIQTRREIADLQKKISDSLGYKEAKIFEAHMLVLEDRMLIEEVIKQIKNQRVNVEFAFYQSIKKYTQTLRELDDEYLKERSSDIEDVAKRVLRKLLKKDFLSLEGIKEKVIVVAHNLSPSDTALLPKSNVLGFITDVGGRTSHTAIIARSLEIPAVVGTEIATSKIKGGETVIVDGTEGIVYVNPTTKKIKEYEKKRSTIVKKIPVAKSIPSQTKDGKKIILSANIELPEELSSLVTYGAEGIGLYRTEYIFLGRKELPSEDEQYKAYVNVARKVRPHSVIIRTIDIGGDKFLSKPQVPYEFTPFLGWRAIRFCLANPHIFKTQLRAILRASGEGNVKIMFPMISGIEELKEAKKILKECKEELRRERKRFDENIAVGVMIEVPSAALIAEILAKECDFFSIGTNDLIQYSLAVDRADEKVAYLYEPAHPAVLRLIRNVIREAHAQGIWVGMCGEMAGDPLFTPLLLGLGLDEFSMPPPSIPKVKELICELTFMEAEEIALRALNFSTPKEVEKFLQEKVREILKDKFHKIFA